MTIYVSLAVALVGILMYFVCTNVKLQYVGFAAYCAGLLAFLLGFSGHALTLVH